MDQQHPAEADPFLAATDIIDWKHPAVRAKASELALKRDDPESIARRCFEWVRDHIEHSSDFKRNPVTCTAAEVLQHRTGYCFAKSHLLAGLLRANGIPAGFCYQRLSMDDTGPPFCLHGFNAVYLREHGWYRMDARGNKEGVNAEFSPPAERLAFSVSLAGERDFPEILAAPLPVVVDALSRSRRWDELLHRLPDWSLERLTSS
ncbi:MAG: transglutaminase domain-containing protein [Bryobacterales bacterium]|nr:transglutaminase domain-containing protein [Bryobacterales bacterium]